MTAKLKTQCQPVGSNRRMRIANEGIESDSPDSETQRLAEGWGHFLRIVEIMRRSDAGQPPFRIVS